MDIIIKAGIFSGLQIVASEKIEKEEVLTIGSFTVSQILYDAIKDYKLLPFEKLLDYQNYIFTSLFQVLFNQIFYPENIKKLIMDELMIMITLFTTSL